MRGGQSERTAARQWHQSDRRASCPDVPSLSLHRNAGELFAWQHDQRHSATASTWFDTESSGNALLPASRAIAVELHEGTRTATLLASDDQPEGLSAARRATPSRPPTAASSCRARSLAAADDRSRLRCLGAAAQRLATAYWRVHETHRVLLGLCSPMSAGRLPRRTAPSKGHLPFPALWRFRSAYAKTADLQVIPDGETRTRTGDTTIFSRVLYQLSYLAVVGGSG
jgi:hypothetical protein